jgi:chromosome partitioning protein
MILTVGNTKGGVGKTTIAVNTAIVRAAAGRDVLLVDGDEQKTAITFTELRSAQLGQPGYTAVSLQGSAIRTQVRQLTPKYDDIIIDVGGRDTGSLRAALTVSDTFLIQSCRAALISGQSIRSPSWSGTHEMRPTRICAPACF